MMKLIVALDKVELAKARDIIWELWKIDEITWEICFKLNDLLSLEWMRTISNVISTLIYTFKLPENSIRLMLDPKWNDIPNTLENYFLRLHESWLFDSADLITLHASAWSKWLKAAVKIRNDLWLKTKILAVTVLTSFDEKESLQVFWNDPKYGVLNLAKIALDAWVDGIVCSAKEARMLRWVFWEWFDIITPWIRFADSSKDDQSRVVTPEKAVEDWATWIVMWRPIMWALDPKQAVLDVFASVNWVESNIDPNEFRFEKLLITWGWEDLLKYIWAIYKRPQWWHYCRLASWLLSDWYVNVWVIERSHHVLERAAFELSEKLRSSSIVSDVIMWAQMWSVRLSSYLAKYANVSESIYAEKVSQDKPFDLTKLLEENWVLETLRSTWINIEQLIEKISKLKLIEKGKEVMQLKRHDIPLKGKRVILSEDVITKWSTIKQMIELVRAAWWEVVAVTCVVNRYWKDEFDWIPLMSCYTPAPFGLFYDEKTPESEIKDWINLLPHWSKIAEKPKFVWEQLVESMR